MFTKRVSKPTSPRVRLGVDSLGARIVPSTVVGLNPTSRVLTIQGDAKDNVVEVAVRGSEVIVTSDGARQSFGVNKVGQLRFLGGAGHDQFVNLTKLPSTAFGEAGNDFLQGGANRDQLFGGDGADHLNGTQGDDVLDGGSGGDVLEGGDGADRLSGGAGDDKVLGGTGSDTLSGGAGRDYLDGGLGRDFIYYTPGVDQVDNAAGDFLQREKDFNDEITMPDV